MLYVNRNIAVDQVPGFGRGLVAKYPLIKGDVIFAGLPTDYIACNGQEFDSYATTTQEYLTKHAFQVGDDSWILRWLSTSQLPAPECINHSCNPNCRWHDGELTLVAAFDIPANAELTVDYGTSEGDPDWCMPCHCGSWNCRKVVSGEDWRLLDSKHLLRYLQDRRSNEQNSGP